MLVCDSFGSASMVGRVDEPTIVLGVTL